MLLRASLCDEAVSVLCPQPPFRSLLSYSFPVLAASGDFLGPPPLFPQMRAPFLQYKMGWGDVVQDPASERDRTLFPQE